LAAAATQILGEQWTVKHDAVTNSFRIAQENRENAEAEVDELIKFNENDFSVVVKDSCTPKQLAEFLEKDAARVNQAQKVYFATAEKVASQVGPTVEGLRLDNILYSLKVGEETEGDVLGIVQQLQGQSLFYRQQLEGLRLKISAKAEVYEFDLEKDFCVIVPARSNRPLVAIIPLHWRILELIKKGAVAGRYVAFLVFVTLLGESEFI